MSFETNVSLCCYNTLILKAPYDGKDDYTKHAKGGVFFGENLDSRYGVRIANKIIGLNRDCVALQEVNKVSFDKLAGKLWQKGYRGIFSNRNNGEDEGVAIFCKEHRFNVVSNYTHYFNDGTGRGVLDVGLNLKENSNISFHFMTTHIDWRPQFLQKECQSLVDYASKITDPKIVCGDFNVTPDDPALQPLWKNNFKDSLYGIKGVTFLNRRIDYILTCPKINDVFHAEVIGDPRKFPTAEEPSDHLPVTTTVRFKAVHQVVPQITAAPVQLKAVPQAVPQIYEMKIKCKVPSGHHLYIHGDGNGLNWDDGKQLTPIDQDHWIFHSSTPLKDFEYKFSIDKLWENRKINRKFSNGKGNEDQPQFNLKNL